MHLIEYRSIADMNRLILENIAKIPANIDLVVGVPRSGMLPANLIALYINKPFTDIDSFIEGRLYSSGERGKELASLDIKRVLIMDDSILSGNALIKAKDKIKGLINKYEIFYGVVFAHSLTKNMVDFYCEVIDYPRIFQWNIFHHPLMNQAGFDMDGVLCEDPKYDDDGEAYAEFIKNARPLYIPTVQIDTIVTCRLEKYREITEEWLRKHNVKYKKLVMLPFKSKRERIKWGKHGVFKGEEAKKNGNILFIESSLSQAQEINRISKIPVFCTETFTLIDSNQKKKKLAFQIKRIGKKGLKRIIGKRLYDQLKLYFRH